MIIIVFDVYMQVRVVWEVSTVLGGWVGDHLENKSYGYNHKNRIDIGH